MLDTTLILYITIGVICIIALYKRLTKHEDYFKNLNVNYLKPYFIFGSTLGFLLRRYSLPDYIFYFYKISGANKIFGFFDMLQPVFLVKDPEVIKKITIKDFDYFENHRTTIDDKADRMFGNSLFFLQSSKWRDMRATLSPAFTGSKMRLMFELVSECAMQTSKYFISRKQENNINQYDMKEIFSRYGNDVIASCAFGLKIDSFIDKDNDFYKTGQFLTKFSNWLFMLKFIIIRALPRIARFFDVQLLDKKIGRFFGAMVLNNISERESKNIYRPDMINILMQVRQGNQHKNMDSKENDLVETIDSIATVEESKIGQSVVKRKWNDDEIVAQCFLFFLAGFDSVSLVLTYTAYELALNTNIQQKLYDEITETNSRINGKRLDYDSLQKMVYMDMVVSEVLRKWPPASVTDRECVKDYLFEFEGMKSFKIKKGDVIWIPLLAIHRDDKYFPNPDKFDPERFSQENKDNIIPGSYLPFGSGPRNCIGSRFALMEIKAIFYYLMLNFSIEPNENTTIPLTFGKKSMNTAPATPVILSFKPRSN